ncbi:MAG TPA: acyltransferase [Verrucomicrobiae bacterium]|nr:acyltransferase [Verrucomicrobiae bacterium]
MRLEPQPAKPAAAATAFRSESTPRLGYVPSLDGIRGVAVLLVVFSHVRWIDDTFSGVAVNTFFVLSGFLITALLTEEWNQNGSISLRRFYLRRALRLLPALIAMLMVFVLLGAFSDISRRFSALGADALHALFYWTNWAQISHYSRHNPFNHTWSLAIEEQFYLLWPLVLGLFLKKTTRSSALSWIFLLCFLAMVLRVIVIQMDPTSLKLLRRANLGLDTRADSLLLGSLGGLAFSSGLMPIQAWVRRMLGFASWVSMAGLCSLVWFDWFRNPELLAYGWFVASALALVVICHLALAQRTALHRRVHSDTAPDHGFSNSSQ